MPIFSSLAQGVGASGFYNDTVISLPLGMRAVSRDGRVYRWCKASSVADLVAGNAIQAPAPLGSTYYNMTTAAASVGATQVTVTPGAAACAANLFSQGYLSTYDATKGAIYMVSSHPANVGSVAMVVVLDSGDPVQVAMTTSTKTELIQNPYNNVIQSPITTLTGAIVGGAAYIITASSNGWIQTWGTFCGLIDGTPAVGQALSCPGAVAGGFAINSGTLDIVASAVTVGVDTKTMPIFLKIGA